MHEHGKENGLVTWFGLFVCLLACGYYFWFFFNRAYVEIEINVAQPTFFKLYWAGENQHFSENRRAAVRLSPERQNYHFFLIDLDRVAKLRLDPIEYPGEATVHRVRVSQAGFQATDLDLCQAEPTNDIGTSTCDEAGLQLHATGIDPYYLLTPHFDRAPVPWLLEAARYALICLVLLTVMRVLAPLRRRFAYVPVLLAMAFVLVVTMAAISKQNAHPDEYVHLKAAAYYWDNWLPPHIDDPAIESTYSVYGISRLHNGEVYYLFAGKLSLLVQAFHVPELFSLRLLNVLLFGLMVLYAMGSVPARLAALPFLLSPMAWYLFSYCSSDAFGLFICFLAACEVLRPQSLLNRLLFAEEARPTWPAVPLLGALLALLLLLKVTYYPFIGFIGIIIVWRLWRQPAGAQRRRALAALAALVVVAGVLAGLRWGADYYVNGLDRQQKLAAMQEQFAHPWYKPSTELHKKHISMYLKERGATLREIVYHHKWFEHTLQTGIGVYGYFTIAAPPVYYQLFKWLLAIFFGSVLLTLLLRGGLETTLFTGLALVLVAALLGVSLYGSWTVYFQAQGRYLFVILPMLGVLLGRAAALFDNRVFIVLLAHIYLLSLYSFIFVALMQIPR